MDPNAYVGLGLVISRTWPTSTSSTWMERQHFYHDGVRRIQEQWYTEKLCFVAGTSVLMVGGSTQPIESIQIWDHVASEPEDMLVEEQTYEVAPILDAYDWRIVRLSMQSPGGLHRDISLLRPAEWVTLTGAAPGEMIHVSLPEMGVLGPARVESVQSTGGDVLRQMQKGTVTGTFVTSNAEVIDVWIDGLGEPIGTTTSHPFWSEARVAWVGAGDLVPGETLRTAKGCATTIGVMPRSGRHTVYNLEVYGDHTYFVSDANLWVHNSCRIVPNRIKQLFGTSKGGAAFLSPDGTAYAATMHVQLQEYLHAHGFWKSAKAPGEAGWYYGIIDEAGDFVGDLLKYGE